MIKKLWLVGIMAGMQWAVQAQSSVELDMALASKLAKLPIHCVAQEYPNKTGHSADSEIDAVLTPQQLHPSFYGCFDWHSSVHGHWMLIRLLNLYPNLPERASIIEALSPSFQAENIKIEAEYFHKYKLGKLFERTYGWAWLLKLDQELKASSDPILQKWHQELQPLTQTIVALWKDYLPKQTYPNRTGVHPNAAFGLAFALDWARAVQDTAFEYQLVQKSKDFYLNNEKTPAYLEPDGADFFSPSLYIADLMTRILDKKSYQKWIENFYEARSIQRICEMPHVSDRMDYQITHLDGLMLSRAWNMKRIIHHLPAKHYLIPTFQSASQMFIKEALHNIDKGNYGGEHWLASFAIYALTEH